MSLGAWGLGGAVDVDGRHWGLGLAVSLYRWWVGVTLTLGPVILEGWAIRER